MEQNASRPVIIDLSHDTSIQDQHLDPPIRIVPSQRRDDPTTAWLQTVANGLPQALAGGTWTTASLIGIGALPATSLRSLQPDERNGQSSRPGSERSKKQYQCPGCDVVFERLSALKQHLLSHTGEKPHACDMCGRRFSISSNLRRHTRTCKVGKFKATQAYPSVVPSNADGPSEANRRRDQDLTSPISEHSSSPWDDAAAGWSSSLPNSDGEDSAEAESYSVSRSSPQASSPICPPQATNTEYPPFATGFTLTTVSDTSGSLDSKARWGYYGTEDSSLQRDYSVQQSFSEPASQVSQTGLLPTTTYSPPPQHSVYTPQHNLQQSQHHLHDVSSTSTLEFTPTLLSSNHFSDRQGSHSIYPIASAGDPSSLPSTLSIPSGQSYGYGQDLPNQQVFHHPRPLSNAASTTSTLQPTQIPITPHYGVHNRPYQQPQYPEVWPVPDPSHAGLQSSDKLGSRWESGEPVTQYYSHVEQP